ncbi:MAG: NAD(P)H-dependent oxidoreductase subunit E [candidate division Zixibacteria bacterium]|nr:NAD(P)H-dependent oxidoreductase subunit E [candidate division Zixibacteria bacterium]
MLIDDLREIQARHGYLPDAELKSLSERKGIPLYEIHGVAGFYPHFRQEPPPAASLRVCTDLSCHLHGACDVLETLRESVRYAGLDQWEVSGVSCLGQCDGAPAVSINGRSYRSMTGERLGRYVSRLAADGEIARQPARRTVNPGCIDPYEHPLAAESLKQWVSCGDAEGLVQAIKDSGLRGMGGAGFPTGVKWDLVRKTASGVKYAICNADESEPGTFKDREILYHYPHLVVEGLILGGLAVGADQGYLFLRHEYDREREVLERTIKAFYSAGYLGDGVLDSAHSFHLEIFDSPGGYICGEETALLEAMEGKRAEPRNKPPFPGTHGLHGRPTLLNNVETFAWVPAILRRGADWFRSQGVNGAVGRKYVALSGHVNRPGVYEIPLGTRVCDLIRDYGGGIAGGRELMAFSPGGTSSGFLPASMADISLDFKPLADAGSMLGSGAVIALAEGSDMVDLARNAVSFFRNESCGKCVPCRTGTEQLVRLLDTVLEGDVRPDALEPVADVAEAMELTSICGLGQAAALPLTSVLRHFPSAFPSRGCQPAGHGKKTGDGPDA